MGERQRGQVIVPDASTAWLIDTLGVFYTSRCNSVNRTAPRARSSIARFRKVKRGASRNATNAHSLP